MFSVKSVVDESLKLPLFTRQVGGSRPTYIHACYKATNHKARGGGGGVNRRRNCATGSGGINLKSELSNNLHF